MLCGVGEYVALVYGWNMWGTRDINWYLGWYDTMEDNWVLNGVLGGFQYVDVMIMEVGVV